jgi:uncharacterized phage protein gp47/JayE
LKQVRSLVRDEIRGTLPGADASIPNSVLRVLSDSQGALCHLTLQYIDWLALQLLPDTAEQVWLDRHADIWLVNADGTTGRKLATLATGAIDFTGDDGTVVPQYTQLTYGSTIGYETTEQITVLGGATVTATARALDPGIAGNLDPGTGLTVTTPIAIGNLATAAINTMTGGVDQESDDDLRMRVLLRIRQPPMGGDAKDYVQWALAVSGCTRAWCYPNEMGIGTVTLRVMFDELRADNDGFPYQEDLDQVKAYLDQVRPVAVKDFWVLSPIKQFIDVYINNLQPNTDAVKAEIEANLKAMLLAKAAPGQTIYASWISYAIMSTPDITSFLLGNPVDDVMPSQGHMAVLRDIYYDVVYPGHPQPIAAVVTPHAEITYGT